MEHMVMCQYEHRPLLVELLESLHGRLGKTKVGSDNYVYVSAAAGNIPLVQTP